ncbi:uncharacterized protein LOC135825300 [Sycon ciliatum]|uniref:uncharacterized protein LOC135825300 n=1 Tax=Sycon ciliatum TaxID=27933 RepID=UPI0031F650FE
MAEASEDGKRVPRDPNFIGEDEEEIDQSTGKPRYRTKPVPAVGVQPDFDTFGPKARVRVELDEADPDEADLPPARDNFFEPCSNPSTDEDDGEQEQPETKSKRAGKGGKKGSKSKSALTKTIKEKIPVYVNPDGTAMLSEDSALNIGNLSVAPIIQSFNELQAQTKDNEDKPVLRHDIRIPNRLAVKSMKILGIVDMVRDIHPDLKEKKFDLAHQAFHLACGTPKEVRWCLNGLIEEAAYREGWTVEQTAEHVADRYVTPKQFFNIIKPEDYDFYEVDYERLEVVALTESGEAIFCHNFTDVYRSYLNRAHHDDIQHLLDRHKRLLEDRHCVNDVYTRICRTGNILARVNTRLRYKTLGDSTMFPLILQDIDSLPEMQMSLVCEKNADYVHVNTPMPDFLAGHGDKIWDIAFENLRRLYVQKTWIKRRCIPRGDNKVAKDGVWLHFLEGYDCECLAFLASTMFMPERMKEVSRIKVKGDVIMGIVRDDVTMLCGSEELWSIAYMAHVGVDSLGHEAYVGVTLRLHKQKDGTLGWILYKPRTAREAVMPQNRVEVDLFVGQMQQKIHPTGCANCHRLVNKLMVCSRCHDNFYCCRDCQKANWKEHKPFCVKREQSKGAITAAEKQTKTHKAPKPGRGKSIQENSEEYEEHLKDNLPKKYHKYVKSLLD